MQACARAANALHVYMGSEFCCGQDPTLATQAAPPWTCSHMRTSGGERPLLIAHARVYRRAHLQVTDADPSSALSVKELQLSPQLMPSWDCRQSCLQPGGHSSCIAQGVVVAVSLHSPQGPLIGLHQLKVPAALFKGIRTAV